ncbi:hypothetical protein [Methylobacterium brachiatum]|uniref:hypothetical protein n=1 Tax=Methylobacterium brachiatum TaxID=269660 RepID=UPI0008E49FAD|nr:hypothetical protein [Methylobacterium brachiatum]CAA2156667.1 hypothetical protein MBRA_02108 [Methylobacterium brachiatum]SFI43949.1 hypothetical protein SAMN02799642_01879 [Methylobacterium brachiatum]
MPYGDAACDADGMGCNRGLVQAAGAIRTRVAGLPSGGCRTSSAKAGCRARLDPLPEAEEQVRGPINGYADLDDMSVALVVALMKLAEGTLCA